MVDIIRFVSLCLMGLTLGFLISVTWHMRPHYHVPKYVWAFITSYSLYMVYAMVSMYRDIGLPPNWDTILLAAAAVLGIFGSMWAYRKWHLCVQYSENNAWSIQPK